MSTKILTVDDSKTIRLIVAKAFKVPAEEVAFIKSEFQTDPMLRRVRPNLPFTGRRLIGLRKGLAASDRYEKAYRTRG